MSHPEPHPTPPPPAILLRQLLPGIVGASLFITLLVVVVNILGVERLQATIAEAGAFAPLAYVALKALTYILAPLTSGPIQLVAGTLFNDLWLGVWYTLAGEVIGGSVNFWLARRFGRPLVVRIAGQANMARLDDFYQRRLHGWRQRGCCCSLSGIF